MRILFNKEEEYWKEQDDQIEKIGLRFFEITFPLKNVQIGKTKEFENQKVIEIEYEAPSYPKNLPLFPSYR